MTADGFWNVPGSMSLENWSLLPALEQHTAEVRARTAHGANWRINIMPMGDALNDPVVFLRK